MASPDVTVASILATSAALNNDVTQAVYTDAKQLPYLQLALQELQEHFELNDMQVTEDTSSEIEIDAGTTEVGFDTAPPLPSDLIEIKELWQRQRGIDPYIPVAPKMEFLPHFLDGQETSIIMAWVFQRNKIQFIPANANLDLKIDYVRELFPNPVTINDILHVINSKTFLEYRTAALVARFIGEDKPRSDELNEFAEFGIDRSTAIGVKGKQLIATRRRPFRASFKQRTVR